MQIQTQHGARSATEENTPGNPKKTKNQKTKKNNPEREMTGGGLPELLSARLFFGFLVFCYCLCFCFLCVFVFFVFFVFWVSSKKAPNNSHEGEIKGGDLPELVCFFGFPRFVLLFFVFFLCFNDFTVLQKRRPHGGPFCIFNIRRDINRSTSILFYCST